MLQALVACLAAGHAAALRVATQGGVPPASEDADILRLSVHNQSIRAKTATWQALNIYEQSYLLQGSHYDYTAPEIGYYGGNTAPIERLGLPPLKMQDGSNGFRTTEPGTEGTTTTYPCPLALASTWDEEMVGKVGQSIANEFRGKGANVMLGPNVNVQRVAQNGKSHQSLSGDDPYLGSRMARAFVKAVQGNGVMCTIREFGFGEQETLRTKYDAVVEERTAWELYYPPFEAAIKAGAGAVMCSYNKVNGTYACHNPDILKRDLRKTMAFDGMVISEWGAVHGIDALESGVDLEMPGRNRKGKGRFRLEQLVMVEPTVVSSAAIHVRSAIFSVGLDKGRTCYPPFCILELRSDQRTPTRLALAREAAVRSVTLLKNDDDLLPLSPENITKIAVLGSASHLVGIGIGNADYMNGGGASHVNWRFGMQSPLEAIRERVKWTEDMQVLTVGTCTNLQAIARLQQVAHADAIVVVAATTSTDNMDRPSLQLDDFADDLIRAVGSLMKPTVVLMQTPGAVTTSWRNLPHVKSIANLFLGGEGTARAWAGLLFGDYSPSGKLPVMFPATDEDVIVPTFNITVNYTEGLFTSYRNSRLRAAFPFGHGLSYTKFKISTPRLLPASANCSGIACAKVNVTNVGKRYGAEVVQAYLEFAPEMREPKILLKGFQKVFLRPNKSQEVIFRFTARDLSVYRADFGWMPQKVVRLHVGNSSGALGDPIVLRVK